MTTPMTPLYTPTPLLLPLPLTHTEPLRRPPVTTTTTETRDPPLTAMALPLMTLMAPPLMRVMAPLLTLPCTRPLRRGGEAAPGSAPTAAPQPGQAQPSHHTSAHPQPHSCSLVKSSQHVPITSLDLQSPASPGDNPF